LEGDEQGFHDSFWNPVAWYGRVDAVQAQERQLVALRRGRPAPSSAWTDGTARGRGATIGQQVIASNSRFVEASRRGDGTRVTGLCADDAILLPSNPPDAPEGRANQELSGAVRRMK
jgi:hypothetical protein